ncbi:MAG: molybdopterin-dependent oxidoreductase [Chloroflexota bacterium]
MKKRYLWLLVTALLVILSACQPAATPTPEPTLPPTQVPTLPPTPVPPPTAAPTDTPAAPGITLEVTGPGGVQSLSLEDLRKLPATEGYAGIKSSTGRITPPALFKGVALKDLMELVGGMDASMGVNIEAEDGYAITYSYDQIMQGDFIAYDPATGEEITIDSPLTVMVAYERDGQPLPEDSDGTFRIAIVSAKNNQVTDGHWAVKWVRKVEVKSFGETWLLKLDGAIQAEIDRATFESCGAPGCHAVTWTDDKAQEWTGIPLYLLAGWIDDEIKHEGPAFNDAVADAGYILKIVADDGYSVELDSQLVKRNKDILVGYLVNGNPLPDTDYPLRLVGPAVEKKLQVGRIAEILLTVSGEALPTPEPTAPPAPTAAPGAEGTLSILGQVEQPLTLDEAGLRALEVVKISAEHPKKGPQEYEGVRLNALLEQAKVKAGASTLVLVASDGYSVEVSLEAVQACADCLVAFSDTQGKFNLVMPGMESSTWIKEIVTIEVK